MATQSNARSSKQSSNQGNTRSNAGNNQSGTTASRSGSRRASTANQQQEADVVEPRTPRANRRGVSQAEPEATKSSARSTARSQKTGVTNQNTGGSQEMSEDERRERYLQSKREAAQRFKMRRRLEANGEEIPPKYQLRISRSEELDANPNLYDDNGNYRSDTNKGNDSDNRRSSTANSRSRSQTAAPKNVQPAKSRAATKQSAPAKQTARNSRATGSTNRR